MPDPSPDAALAHVDHELRRLGVRFALVGGLAVSIRAEVRFTRDVDLAIAARDDAAVEALVWDLRGVGYDVVATVEHTERKRLATVRLSSPSSFVVDLLAASSGIEEEIVDRSTLVTLEGIGAMPVARSEELLAMKVLSMSEARLQDRIDAVNLVLESEVDLAAVRDDLALITRRGFHRQQDLEAKLAQVLAAADAT